MVFTFLKGCKTKQNNRLDDRDELGPTWPEIFTIWPFTEKVCQLLSRQKKVLSLLYFKLTGLKN